MSALSLSEIEHALTSHSHEYKYDHTRWGGKKGTDSYTMGWDEWWNSNEEDHDIPGVGTVSVVKSHGGEGEGDSAWVVLMVINEDGSVRYFRKEGWYQSYDGATFDGDFSEVSPKAKTITVWE